MYLKQIDIIKTVRSYNQSQPLYALHLYFMVQTFAFVFRSGDASNKNNSNSHIEKEVPHKQRGVRTSELAHTK